MLSAIFSAVGGNIVDSVLSKVMGTFQAYFNKQISIEELRAAVTKAMLESFTEVEKSHADALAKTYDSFMKAMVQSPLMQRMWALALGTQIFVLFFYQFAVPLLCYLVSNKTCYPSAGASVEWAYLLIGGLLGMGPLVLRAGPGAGNIADKIKGLSGR